MHKPSDWKFVGDSFRAIELIKKLGYLGVVTNQSGIARKYYTKAHVGCLRQNVNDLLWQTRGVTIETLYVCPHHPQYTGKCACRKPEPEMLLKAADDLNIDLSNF